MHLQPGQSDDADIMVTKVPALHTNLSQLSSLSPPPRVNSLFEKLVDLCCNTSDKVVTEKASKIYHFQLLLKLSLTAQCRS